MKHIAVTLALVLLAGPLVLGRDVEFDRFPSEIDLDDSTSSTRGWRSLLTATPRTFYGCTYLEPGESYSGSGARITTVELASVNTTGPAVQACCKLCYFVTNCRKWTLKKKIDGLEPGQVWSANCTLYRKTAKKTPAPMMSQYFIAGGILNLEAPPPMG